jgi:hypothetical protein
MSVPVNDGYCFTEALAQKTVIAAARYRSMAVAMNRATPEIRCRIEVIAGSGNLNVVISRLTGRVSFTVNLSGVV